MQLFFAGLVGAALLIGVAQVVNMLRKRIRKISGKVSDVILTVCVALQLLAGAELIGAGPGSWIRSAIHQAFAFIGAVPTMAVLAIAGLFMLALLVIAFVESASEGAMWTATAFPVLCSLFATGIFAKILVALEHPAGVLTAHLMSGLGV
jgi:hypothetical protein